MVSCPSGQKKCPPLIADGFDDHPYAITIDPRKKCATGKLGINCLSETEQLLQWAHDRKLLAAPDGERLPLDIGEFSYNVRAPEINNNVHIRHPDADRYISDSVRTRRLQVVRIL